MQNGWVCPKCDTVFSPFVAKCLNCSVGKNGLSVTQKKYVEFYADFYKRNGRYPTYREAGEELKMCASNIFYVMKKARAKGYLSDML